MSLLDFLVIGEMKCGTTTLWSLLAQHPQVFRPREKELHFFASYSYFGASGPDKLGDLDAYLRNFADAGPGQLRGEATPNYLMDRLAPQRIAQTMPGVRLVAVLRDPVARAWSHYWHVVRRGWEALEFEDALDAEDARMNRGDDEREKFSYVTRGKYIEHLRRYEALFGREAICVVFLDELTGNQQNVVEEVWRHIGCPLPYPTLTTPAHDNRADYPKWPWASRLTRRGMAWA
ncbi:MAG: sulfotransferase domain-containing protein, partial [Candidatus Hydrogenedentales bacterium]